MSRFMIIIEMLETNGNGARAGEGFSLVFVPDPAQSPGPLEEKCHLSHPVRGLYVCTMSTPDTLSACPQDNV
jgi:hypothetical protein